MTSDQDLFKSAFRSRFKVFLSADIVGSTAYKQAFDISKSEMIDASVRNSLEWQKTIQQFYDRLINDFPRKWTSFSTRLGNADSEEYKLLAGELGQDDRERDGPHFWKTVGDEVIFWKEITNEHQLWLLLSSWFHAISDLRKQLHPLSLDVKSSIWSAEFPVRNRLVSSELNVGEQSTDKLLAFDSLKVADRIEQTPTDDIRMAQYVSRVRRFYRNPTKNNRLFDFIGPGIDVGFRISSFSTLKKTALSIDVVYLLALSALRLVEEEDYILITGYNNDKFTRDFIYKLRNSVVKLDRPKSLDFSYEEAKHKNRRPITDTSIYFGGNELVKGVLGGMRYPKIWIDTAPVESYSKKKELLYSTHHRYPVNWKSVYHFCMAFYHEYRKFVQPPVILEGGELSATSRDESLTERYNTGLHVFHENVKDVIKKPQSDSKRPA